MLISITYGCWFLLYEFVLKQAGEPDHFVTEYITIGICRLLDLTGHDSYYTIALKPGETYVYLKPGLFPAVRVGASCNGLELLALFTIFILCFPGRWLLKIPFIVAGNLLIHGANILRNYWLTLLAVQHSPNYEIYHRYVFIFMMYGIIFGLWMLWANYFSKLPQTHEK